jgi:NADH-quinone oxidoreductase subunit G
MGHSRPAWKILRVLGNLLDLPGFDYQSSEQVRDELRAAMATAAAPANGGVDLPPLAGGIEPLVDVPTYQVDSALRRALPLQHTRIGRLPAVEYAP